MELDVMYEDEDVLVVNKPAGLVVHPGNGNYAGTLVHGVAWHLLQQQNQSPTGFVEWSACGCAIQ